VEWFSEEFEWAETPESVGASRTHPNKVYVDYQDADLFTHQQVRLGMILMGRCFGRAPWFGCRPAQTHAQAAPSNPIIEMRC